LYAVKVARTVLRGGCYRKMVIFQEYTKAQILTQLLMES